MAPKPKVKPNNPWTEHLRSLVGRKVDVLIPNTPGIVASGVLKHVAIDRIDVAILREDGVLVTVKCGGLVIIEQEPRLPRRDSIGE